MCTYSESYKYSPVLYKVKAVCTPDCITDLVTQYLYDHEDQIYGLAYTLYRSLAKLHRYSITLKMLKQVIKHYIVNNVVRMKQNSINTKHSRPNTQELETFYFDQLLKLKYLAFSNKECVKLLQIPMEMRMEFGSLKNLR